MLIQPLLTTACEIINNWGKKYLKNNLHFFINSTFPVFQVKSGGWLNRLHSCWMRSVKSLRLSVNVNKRLVLVSVLPDFWLETGPVSHTTVFNLCLDFHSLKISDLQDAETNLFCCAVSLLV